MQPAAAWLLLSVLAHVGLVFFLYAMLTVLRMRAVKRGEVEFGCFVLGREEPHDVARVTRNLANQFELPVIFYMLVSLLIANNQILAADIVAAWIFVAGRLVHSYIQTRTDNVPLRGKLFTINFLAVVFLAAHVAWIAVESLR